MKQVRIDKKTVIEVDERVSDERAREEYLEKIGKKPKVMGGFKKGYKSDRSSAQDIPRNDIVFNGDNKNRDTRNKGITTRC